MTTPDSRGRRSLGVFAESQAIGGSPCDARRGACRARARSSTTAFRASAKARVETVSSAEPASAIRRPRARRDEAREQPDHGRGQGVGGQDEAGAGLGEVKAVGVGRQQRHHRLVERGLDEHRQSTAIVMRRALTSRFCPLASQRCVAAAWTKSTMWRQSFDHSPTRRCAGSSRTTTLRFGARRHLTAPVRERPERNPPRPAYVLRHGTTARGRRRPPRDPGRRTCSRQCSPYWDSSSGLCSRPRAAQSRRRAPRDALRLEASAS